VLENNEKLQDEVEEDSALLRFATPHRSSAQANVSAKSTKAAAVFRTIRSIFTNDANVFRRKII
jgi:hypothetical protein